MKCIRYDLLYQFFAAQIEFGYYQKGDFLPSVELLCSVYQAAPRTVRNAYLQLQEDGYITVSPGRRTTVVYEATPEDYRLNTRNYYLARKDAILGLNQALEVLLLPLIREGCGRLGRHELLRIRETAVRLETGDFYISLFFGHTMLLALKNRMALDLFNEVISFYQFPHALATRGAEAGLMPPKRYQTLAREAVAACDSGDREALYRVYLQIQSSMDETLRTLMIHAEQEHPPQTQVPFLLKDYRQRPQLCYSLAAQWIRRIYIDRDYGPGQFLPAYGVLAKNCSVSYTTVRRTMHLMNELGAVITYHGVGTQVVMPAVDLGQPRSPMVKKIITRFREIMQIICLDFDALAAHAEPKPGDTQVCLERLRIQPQEDGFTAFLICIDYLLQGLTGASGVREKFYQCLLLGLPLLEAADRIAPVRDRLIEGLESGDLPAFCAGLKDLTLEVFKIAQSLA